MIAWKRDPVRFVREFFGVEPDWWQREALEEYGKPGRKRIAMQACVGPGKTAVLAWIAWNFLVCHGDEGEHPNGVAVAITRDNLRDNLFKELAKWRQRTPFLLENFEWTTERVFHKRFPETWFIAAKAWSQRANPEEQARSMSGFHGQYVLAVIDEAGPIPTTVLRSAHQVLSNCTDGAIVMAGNPTTTEGMLYAASVTEADRWVRIRITGDPDDPKRSPRIDIEEARAAIATYGRDNPWVKAHILGEWPEGGINTLLTVDDVDKAMARSYRAEAIKHAPRVLGVDVAREGMDRTVIFPRQGLVAFEPTVMHGHNGLDVAGHIARIWQDWKVDACFIDDTGGWAGSVIDQLRYLKYEPIPIGFAGKANDLRYANKRTEMAFECAEWVRTRGQLPKVPDLVQELVVPTYGFRGDRMQLIEKEQIKTLLHRSPDMADALGLTFAQPVRSKIPEFVDLEGGIVLGPAQPSVQPAEKDDYYRLD